MQAAALVAAPLAYLMTNDFERGHGREARRSTSPPTRPIQTATLERAWLERTGPVRPGTTVPLKVAAAHVPRRDASRRRSRSPSPPTRPPAPTRCWWPTAPALTALEQREMRQPFVPRDLDQLIRAINGLRHNNHVYARLLRTRRGRHRARRVPAVAAARRCCPSSAASEQGGSVVPIRTAAVWDFDLPTDYAVTGSRLLTLTVER